MPKLELSAIKTQNLTGKRLGNTTTSIAPKSLLGIGVKPSGRKPSAERPNGTRKITNVPRGTDTDGISVIETGSDSISVNTIDGIGSKFWPDANNEQR